MAAKPKDAKDILKNKALWVAIKKKLDDNNEELWDEVWDDVGETAFKQGEKAAFQALRLKWKEDPSRAQRYFDEHGGQFIKEVTDSDLSSIQQIIASNWGEGERSVGKLIDDQLGGEDRGRFIYRTEIHTAHEKSSKATSEELGAGYWVWVAVMDQRTRDAHWGANGQIQPMGQPFKLTDPKEGEYETEPGDEINCRCRALSFMTLKEALDFVASLGSEVSDDTIAWNVSLSELQENANECHDEKGQFCSSGGSGSSSRSLSDQEKSTIVHYTRTGYAAVNYDLRHPGKAFRTSKEKAQIKETIKTIESAIDKSKLSEETHVYRGMGDPELAKNFDKLKGTTIEDKAFLSTTKEITKTGSFAKAAQYATKSEKPIIARITLPKGTKALDVTGTTEQEVLLQKGAKFEVTGTLKSKSYWFIDMRAK